MFQGDSSVTTPPPQGNPFTQDQPQGQNPYAQGQPGATPYAPVQPQQPKRGIKQYLRIAVTVVALISVGIGWYVNRNAEDAKKLAVGDCMYNKGSDSNPDVIQVDCGDAKATHTVLKKADGALVPQLTCQSVEGTTATLTWEETGDSFTLCLGDNK